EDAAGEALDRKDDAAAEGVVRFTAPARGLSQETETGQYLPLDPMRGRGRRQAGPRFRRPPDAEPFARFRRDPAAREVFPGDPALFRVQQPASKPLRREGVRLVQLGMRIDVRS